MIRSAFCAVIPGSDSRSSFEALFRSTEVLDLEVRPSLTPSATALVSRLRVDVASAVFSRSWSGDWFGAQAAQAPRIEVSRTRWVSRIGMLFGCRSDLGGWHPRKIMAYLRREK